MDNERVDPCGLDRVRERKQRLLGILLIDSNPALDRHRNPDGSPHGSDAISNHRRFRHQAGTKPPFLHAVRWTADVEVDLIVAKIFADTRRLGERCRIATAKLQSYRMFARVKAEQPCT